MILTAHLQNLIARAEQGETVDDLNSRVGGNDGVLQAILAVLAEINASFSSEAKTTTGTLINASGDIAAGAHSHILVFSSDFTGTVAGLAYDGESDASITISAPLRDTLPAIAVVVTTGSIRVTSVSP